MLYHGKNKTLRSIYFVLIVLIFIAYVPPHIALFLQNEDSVSFFINWTALANMSGYSLLAISFLIVGIRFRLSGSTKRILSKKMTLISRLVVITFIIRGSIQITNLVSSALSFLTGLFFFDFAYWTLLELFPLILMLTILDTK